MARFPFGMRTKGDRFRVHIWSNAIIKPTAKRKDESYGALCTLEVRQFCFILLKFWPACNGFKIYFMTFGAEWKANFWSQNKFLIKNRCCSSDVASVEHQQSHFGFGEVVHIKFPNLINPFLDGDEALSRHNNLPGNTSRNSWFGTWIQPLRCWMMHWNIAID